MVPPSLLTHSLTPPRPQDPIGIPTLYGVLLYSERGTLAIDQHQHLANKPHTYAIMKTFCGFRATTSVRDPDPEKQRLADEAWEKLKIEHYLSFLISPYERRVYW